MDLKELQKNWDQFGKTDPLWAILANPSRRGGGWQPEEFFASGRREITNVMSKAEALGLPARRERALDFGCGVGRLTQALCAWFQHCCGVDIAPSMMELARRYNVCGDKCEYFLNTSEDLRMFPDAAFDLVYSNIVLQHMEPRYSTLYIREFVRVLQPQGLLVFQVPNGPRSAMAGPDRQKAQGPMPEDGFRASLTGYPASVRAVAGSQVSIPVTVKNLGPHVWPSLGNREQKYVINLGNHWLTPDGKTAIWDDGRQSLPFDLQPSAEIQTALTVTAPLAPGEYILELDMVQEAVAWFKDKSSIPARVQAVVEASPASVAVAAGEPAPRMEMYGIEKVEVIDILRSEGARVLEIVEENWAGPEWLSFQYFATKS